MPAGLVACLLEVAGYYVATPLRGFPVATNEIAFWGLCAVVGGPIFGWAAWAWRRGAPRYRGLGAAFLPGTFLGEALGAYLVRLHYLGDAALFGAIGLAALGALASVPAPAGPARPTVASVRPTLLFTVVVTGVGTLVYGLLLGAVSGVAFGV